MTSLFLLLCVFLCSFPCPSEALRAKLSFPPNTTHRWENSDTQMHHTLHYKGGAVARILLSARSYYHTTNKTKPYFACGFVCIPTPSSCFFSVFVTESESGSFILETTPQVVWTANRHHPVGEKATLEWTRKGRLVLRDKDGSTVWSAGRISATTMALVESGNLRLLDASDSTLWASFRMPTDTLLVGQRMGGQRRLISKVSATNYSEGMFYLMSTRDYLGAFTRTDPPQSYLRLPDKRPAGTGAYGLSIAIFGRGSLEIWYDTHRYAIDIPKPASIQYMRLDFDGHLKVYEWAGVGEWKVVLSFSLWQDNCEAPLVCGQYGLCSNSRCSCPRAVDGSHYFQPVNPHNPDLGCVRIITSFEWHDLVDFGNLSYFGYTGNEAEVLGIKGIEACKSGCSESSSCQAAFFRYEHDPSHGRCYLLSQVFSLRERPIPGSFYKSSAFIKVNLPPPPPQGKRRSTSWRTVVEIVGAVVLFEVTIIGFVYFSRGRAAGENGGDADLSLTCSPCGFSCNHFYRTAGRLSNEVKGRGFDSETTEDDPKFADSRVDNLGQVICKQMAP